MVAIVCLLHDLINKTAEGDSGCEVVSPTLDRSTSRGPQSSLRCVLIFFSISRSLFFLAAGSGVEFWKQTTSEWTPGSCWWALHVFLTCMMSSSASAGATSYGMAPLPVVNVLHRLSSPWEKTHAALQTFAVWYSSVFSAAFMCVYWCERQACELSSGSHRACWIFAESLHDIMRVCCRVYVWCRGTRVFYSTHVHNLCASK